MHICVLTLSEAHTEISGVHNTIGNKNYAYMCFNTIGGANRGYGIYKGKYTIGGRKWT